MSNTQPRRFSLINVVCVACSVKATTNLFLIPPSSHLLERYETILPDQQPYLLLPLLLQNVNWIQILQSGLTPRLLTARGWSLESCCMESLRSFSIYFLLVTSTANLLCSQAKGWCMQLPGLHSQAGSSPDEGCGAWCFISSNATSGTRRGSSCFEEVLRQGLWEPLFCAVAVALWCWMSPGEYRMLYGRTSPVRPLPRACLIG